MTAPSRTRSEPTRDEPTRDELERWDREIVWHAFTQMSEYQPFIIQRARGCTLVDLDGREYLDGVSSLWCNIHGHRHPTLDAAVRRQLDEVAHVTLLGASHPTTIKLAKRLVDIAPDGLRHVFFSDSGRHGRGSGLEDGPAILAAAHAIRGPRRPPTWRWAMPTTATRWAA